MATHSEFHISWIKRRHGIVEVQGYIFEGDVIGPDFVRSAKLADVGFSLPDQAAQQAIDNAFRARAAQVTVLPLIPEQAQGGS